MTIEIRTANIEDARQIAEMHIASWRAAYTGIVNQEWLDSRDIEQSEKNWCDNLRTVENGEKTFLAFDQAVLAGFATIGNSRNSSFPDYAELWAIYAHPDYYGTGIGTLLFNRCTQYAIENGMKNMFVNVLVDNKRGRDFYERKGAVPVANSEGDVLLGNIAHRDMKYEWKELER